MIQKVMSKVITLTDSDHKRISTNMNCQRRGTRFLNLGIGENIQSW